MSKKITVVVQANYALAITDGRHLVPGEVTEVDDDQFVQDCIAAGLLAPVVLPSPEATRSTAPRKSDTTTPQETD